MDAKPAENANGPEKAQGCFICDTAMPLLERCLGAPPSSTSAIPASNS